MLVPVGYLSLSGQPAGGEPAVAQHFAAAERIPNSVTDLIFDDKGLLWIAPDNENIRLFDGSNVKILEAPFAKGVPQF